MEESKRTVATEREGASQERSTVRSVERAFDLLGCFSAENKTITLTEAARAADLPVSTVSRLLGTLEASQFVRRLPDGRYMPGGRLLRIGVVALHGVELYDVSEGYLERLASLSGETVNLAIPTHDGQALYLRQVASRHSVRHENWIGRSVPLKGTAIGEAITGEVNAQGYAVRHTTLEPDVTAIAAPIFGADGQIIAAFSITSPSYRIDEAFIARAGTALVREAQDLSFHLGAPGAKTAGGNGRSPRP